MEEQEQVYPRQTIRVTFERRLLEDAKALANVAGYTDYRSLIALLATEAVEKRCNEVRAVVQGVQEEMPY